MKKKDVINAMIKVIEEISNEKNIQIINKGYGHAFDGSFWEDIFEDDSEIPEVVAGDKAFSISLRSLWGSPELCIRRLVEKGEELLVIRYSDSEKVNDEYINSGNFKVREVRVDCYNNYKSCIDEAYKIIEKIEKIINEVGCKKIDKSCVKSSVTA